MQISDNLKLALELLKKKEVIAVATDTVYGLAALGTSPEARAKIFALKGRDASKQLPFQFPDINLVAAYAQVSLAVSNIMYQFMPGALTIILPKADHCQLCTEPYLQSIAVRIPNHGLLLQLLRQLRVPLAITSANLATEPAAVTSAEVEAIFGQKIKLLLDDPETNCLGTASTVVDLTGRAPVLLRPGAVSFAAIVKSWDDFSQLGNF